MIESLIFRFHHVQRQKIIKFFFASNSFSEILAQVTNLKLGSFVCKFNTNEFKKRFIEIRLVLQDLLSFKVDDLEFYQQLILTNYIIHHLKHNGSYISCLSHGLLSFWLIISLIANIINGRFKGVPPHKSPNFTLFSLQYFLIENYQKCT